MPAWKVKPKNYLVVELTQWNHEKRTYRGWEQPFTEKCYSIVGYLNELNDLLQFNPIYQVNMETTHHKHLIIYDILSLRWFYIFIFQKSLNCVCIRFHVKWIIKLNIILKKSVGKSMKQISDYHTLICLLQLLKKSSLYSNPLMRKSNLKSTR